MQTASATKFQKILTESLSIDDVQPRPVYIGRDVANGHWAVSVQMGSLNFDDMSAQLSWPSVFIGLGGALFVGWLLGLLTFAVFQSIEGGHIEEVGHDGKELFPGNEVG